jgi:hypothetical protein
LGAIVGVCHALWLNERPQLAILAAAAQFFEDVERRAGRRIAMSNGDDKVMLTKHLFAPDEAKALRPWWRERPELVTVVCRLLREGVERRTGPDRFATTPANVDDKVVTLFVLNELSHNESSVNICVFLTRPAGMAGRRLIVTQGVKAPSFRVSRKCLYVQPKS